MQVTRSYAGTLADVGTTSARQLSFGAAGTQTAYWNKIDFINQTIADFLKNDCGVDVAYEIRDGATVKFLWIYDVPFLFSGSSSTNSFYLYGPYNTTSIAGTSANVPTFFGAYSGTNIGVYSFSLIFCGNPETGFALRFKTYNSSAVKSATCFRFMRAKNTLTGGNAVVWCWGDATAAYGVENNANGIDLDENGEMIESSYSTAVISYLFSLNGKAANKDSSGGKVALVPLMIGVWQVPGIYCHIRGLNLTVATTLTTEIQTEIEISGRRFLQTVNENAASGYINMGLIEVT